MEKDMEFGEHENQVQEEMVVLQVPPPPPEHDSLEKSKTKIKTSVAVEKGAINATPVDGAESIVGVVRYRECQKNHTISIGGYTVDGCGEFMGAGEEDTLEGVICGACNCHRNFHRKEVNGIIGIGSYQHQPWPQPHPPPQHHHNQFSSYYQRVPPPPHGACYYHLVETPPVSQHHPIALLATSDGGYNHEDDDMFNPSNSGGGSAKKRFRTKFTKEQKDKMLAFVEKLGWRIHKHDAAVVEQFCSEIGVNAQVLKVWMHNNKHTLSKKA